MNPEEKELHDEIMNKMIEHKNKMKSGPYGKIHVIVIDYSTWQQLKNNQLYYKHAHQTKDREERYAGIPLAVKMNKKEKEISVY